METPTCPRCGAPRLPRLDCPKCGVIYAKAEARRTPATDTPLLVPIDDAPPAPAWEGAIDEDAVEFRIRLLAVPIALAVAWGLMHMGFLRSLLRTFLTMWIHELGHAVTGWFCGFGAIPGPWLTRIPEERSFMTTLLLAGAIGAWLWRSWQRENRFGLVLGALLLLTQLICTFGLSAHKAQALILFGGDGGLFVLGTALMATMFVERGHHLQVSWLRWGFLVIGACSFADGFKVWWDSKHDFAAIPFGENEGVTTSDPTKLVDVYGWDTIDMINRFLGLAAVCLVALAIAYAVSLIQARAKLR